MEAYRSQLFDLVLMDVQMPEPDDLAATRQSADAAGYLTKPLEAGELFSTVAAMVESSTLAHSES